LSGRMWEGPGTCSSPLSARDDGRVETELEIGRLKELPCVELTKSSSLAVPTTSQPAF
jgi:hypothetical protein